MALQPQWGLTEIPCPNDKDIQFLPAQLATRPLLDEQAVNTKVVIGPKAKKPLELEIFPFSFRI